MAPDDPNCGLLKSIPDWTSVGRNKEGRYILGGKLDKFGAPYGIYCLLSGMMEYFQQVERVRNPEAVPDNPYKAKLGELLEKAVREALEENASALRQDRGGHKKNARKGSGKPDEIKSVDQPVKEAPPTAISESPVENNNAPTGSPPEVSTQGGPPTEKDVKGLETLLEISGVKEMLKDILKKPE